ncbi:MAG TPA: ABC transporter substrate-binding protein, partial [Candidatus Lustribacter sp.]
SPAVAFFRAMHQAAEGQKKIPILVNGATVDEYDLPAMGDAPAGAISAIQYVPALPGDFNARFTKAFSAAFGGDQQPDFMAEAGYDSMTMIDRAVAAQKSPQLDPDASMRTLRGLSIDSPRGPFRIDAQTREPVQNIYICRTIMRGGRAVDVPLETIRSVNANGVSE